MPAGMLYAITFTWYSKAKSISSIMWDGQWWILKTSARLPWVTGKDDALLANADLKWLQATSRCQRIITRQISLAAQKTIEKELVNLAAFAATCLREHNNYGQRSWHWPLLADNLGCFIESLLHVPANRSAGNVRLNQRVSAIHFLEDLGCRISAISNEQREDVFLLSAR